MSLEPATFAAAPERTALAVVDIQDKLLAAMPEATQRRVVAATRTLIQGVATVGGQITITEQYPKGLGPTVAPLLEAVRATGIERSPLAKVEFDCCGAPGFLEGLRAARVDTVVLAGMEAHICVLQTAVGLRRAGLRVWVGEEAIASRDDAHRQSAIRVLGELGVLVLPVESVLFTLLGKAGTQQFKAVSALIK